MEIPTLREATCQKKLDDFKARLALQATLSPQQRDKLLEEMKIFRDSLGVANNALVGAGLGLVAAWLPVIGWISGPLIGGGLATYQTFRLQRFRSEVERMIERLEG